MRNRLASDFAYNETVVLREIGHKLGVDIDAIDGASSLDVGHATLLRNLNAINDALGEVDD